MQVLVIPDIHLKPRIFDRSEEILKAGKEMLDADIDDVIAAVNSASPEYLWNDMSPLWYRPQYSRQALFRNDIYTQVVGHTPVEKICKKGGVISTDVFSTYRSGKQIGEPAMIVIDSGTGEYEKVEVRNMRKIDEAVMVNKGICDYEDGRTVDGKNSLEGMRNKDGI